MLWVLRDLAGKQLMGNLAPTWHLHTPSDSDHHIQHHIDQHIDHKYCSACSYNHIFIDHVLTTIYNSHLIDNCTEHHIYHHASYIIYHVLLPINDHITWQWQILNRLKSRNLHQVLSYAVAPGSPSSLTQVIRLHKIKENNLISKWNSIVVKAPSYFLFVFRKLCDCFLTFFEPLLGQKCYKC